jgi:thiol-disulfide isomerase/thioredoxin
MKTYFIIIIISLFTFYSCSVSKNPASPILANQLSKDSRGNDMLLGKCTRSALQQSPFVDWFKPNYDSYVVDSFTCNFIRPLLAGKSITIFMGTWCGDSKREVPRVLKMLDCCGFSANNLTLVMVSNKDSLYKKSPQHEEAGKNIVRVPTIIIEQKGTEIGRIIEFPIIRLEKDLLSILRKEKYQPNYHQLKADTR